MKERTRFLFDLLWVSLVLIFGVIAGLLFLDFASSGLANLGTSSNGLLFLLGGAFAASALILFQRTLTTRLPVAHNIAIFGFPQSGKTTLITIIFGEIFAARVTGMQASLVGASTIETVNKDLMRLARREALVSTSDKEVRAYRANLRINGFPFPRVYKIEIGDFPGEDSEEYAEKYGEWFHNTPYFKFATSADAFIFVIDLGKYLDPDARIQYVSVISAAIRAAWQNLKEDKTGGLGSLEHLPVVLAFTKTDLLGIETEKKGADELKSQLHELGFGPVIPPMREIDKAILDTWEPKITEDFADLIKYLSSETKTFNTVFLSCFGTLGRTRLGIADLLLKVLPQ